MNLLIVEPEATGHHMALYVRWIVREAFRRNWHVWLMTTKSAMTHPSFRLVNEPSTGHLNIAIMPEFEKAAGSGVAELLAGQGRYYNAVAQGFRMLDSGMLIDHVYMNNFDYMDKVLAVRGSPFDRAGFSGMMMDVKFHRRRMGVGPRSRSDHLYKYLFHRMLRIPTLKAVTVVNETFIEYAKNKSVYRKVFFVPDVGQVGATVPQHDARQALGIPEDKFVILVYGSLSRRKGISELLQAVRRCEQKRVAVLLAGSPDKEIVSLIGEQQAQAMFAGRKLFFSAGFHNEAAERNVFGAADAVWLGYSSGWHGSSGVLYQAGSVRLPLIASRHGVIGWLARRRNLGVLVEPADSDSVARTIAEFAADRERRLMMGQNGRLLADDHSPDRFGNAICDAIAACF